MYKVYISAAEPHYRGTALIAAESVKDANEILNQFRKDDPHNKLDSFGFCNVEPIDEIEDVFSNKKGIVHDGIYYWG